SKIPDVIDMVFNQAGALGSQAAADVLAERLRQVEKEGWDAEHDDAHTGGSLAMAGACYASLAAAAANTKISNQPAYQTMPPSWHWPWDRKWWKPKNPRRDLVRAAALILAE